MLGRIVQTFADERERKNYDARLETLTAKTQESEFSLKYLFAENLKLNMKF